MIVVNSACNGRKQDAEKYYVVHDAYVAAVIKALHK